MVRGIRCSFLLSLPIICGCAISEKIAPGTGEIIRTVVTDPTILETIKGIVTDPAVVESGKVVVNELIAEHLGSDDVSVETVTLVGAIVNAIGSALSTS